MSENQIEVTWHSFDLRSGARQQPVQTQGGEEFGRIIGESTDTQVDVLIWDEDATSADPDGTGAQIPGIISATDPGRTMLVALDQDERILWGGLVLRRVSTTGIYVSLTPATLEHYFDRRFSSDLSWEAVDQAAIAEGVIDDIAVDGLSFVVDAPTSGIPRDLEITEDKTTLSVLQSLQGLYRGPEFTVDLEWDGGDHTHIRYVVRFRERLGVATRTPMEFRLPGSVTEFEHIEDFTEEFAANDTMAISSGEGDARPTSSHHVATDLLANGWARFERRFEPASSTTDVAALDAAAAADLEEHKLGSRDFSLTANLDTAPRIGIDFNLGDDVTTVITCPRFPAYIDSNNRLRPGFTAVGRCVGWKMNTQARTLTPTLRPPAAS